MHSIHFYKDRDESKDARNLYEEMLKAEQELDEVLAERESEQWDSILEEYMYLDSCLEAEQNWRDERDYDEKEWDYSLYSHSYYYDMEPLV